MASQTGMGWDVLTGYSTDTENTQSPTHPSKPTPWTGAGVFTGICKGSSRRESQSFFSGAESAACSVHPATPPLGIPLPAQTAPRCIWRGRREGAAGWPARCRGRPQGCCSPSAPCCSCTPVCSCEAQGSPRYPTRTHACLSTGALLRRRHRASRAGVPLPGTCQHPPPQPRGEPGEKGQLLLLSCSSCCDPLHPRCIFSSAEVGIKGGKKQQLAVRWKPEACRGRERHS